MVKSKDHSGKRQKKVFYIEKGDFLRSMMEFAIKAHGAEIYTIATLENNLYLLGDLGPELVIFDVQTSLDYIDKITEYAEASGAILVAVGNDSDREIVKEKVKIFISKPIEAKNIGSRLLALLD